MSWPLSILLGVAVLAIGLAARLWVRASNGTLDWSEERPLWSAALVVAGSGVVIIALGPVAQATLPPLIAFGTSLVLATQRIPARNPAVTPWIRRAGVLGLIAAAAWLLQIAVSRLA